MTEVIAVLDGYWIPRNEVVNDKRVRYLHKGKAQGMRPAINDAVAIARGEYIMKLDAHCMMDKNFDVKLLADMQDDWVVIPRRKRLDAENWAIQDVGKPDVDYNYLSFPDNPGDFGGAGLNGRIWTERALERTDPKYDIDEELSFQGSCWFMKRDYFYFLELMDYENFGEFWNEAQEIGFKAWLSGGKVMRNKKTWYAHLHKGKKYGRGYHLNSQWATKGASHTMRFLYEDKVWHKQIHPLTWLIEKFMPMPGWADNWKELIKHPDGIKPQPLAFIQANYRIDTTGEQPIKLPGGRDGLAKLLAELKLNRGVEIGVEKGLYSEVLCRSNPNIELDSIDAWTAYKGYRDHVSQEKIDGFYEKTKERLGKYNCKVIKAFSMDAVKEYDDESLDFVYIDGNHSYKYVLEDLTEWEKKVRIGGIVAGHDYRDGDGRWVCDVKKVVDEWVSKHEINPLFIFVHEDEKSPSWFWIKTQSSPFEEEKVDDYSEEAID